MKIDVTNQVEVEKRRTVEKIAKVEWSLLSTLDFSPFVRSFDIQVQYGLLLCTRIHISFPAYPTICRIFRTVGFVLCPCMDFSLHKWCGRETCWQESRHSAKAMKTKVKRDLFFEKCNR
jgi:hypothetical protein